MGKRKRESTANDAAASEEAPASKVKVTQTEGKASAERRQKRSERQSRKSTEARAYVHMKRDGAIAATGSTKPVSEDFVSLVNGTESAAEGQQSTTTTGNKSKRSTRRSPRAIRKEARAAKAEIEAEAGESPQNDQPKSKNDPTQTSKDARFIVFVGNLPFTTTTAQIQQHFRKLNPIHIRHNTEKGSNKSKGFAFVEFDGYDKMKTALKLYHHSIFDPARTTESEREAGEDEGVDPTKETGKMSKTARKINVELTAGGGGKSQKRVEKIESKNKKLAEERERRKQEEMKQERAKHAGRKKESVKEAEEAEMSMRKKEEQVQSAGLGDVHPSRMKRVRHA